MTKMDFSGLDDTFLQNLALRYFNSDNHENNVFVLDELKKRYNVLFNKINSLEQELKEKRIKIDHLKSFIEDAFESSSGPDRNWSGFNDKEHENIRDLEMIMSVEVRKKREGGATGNATLNR
jgi:hypothetical protein